MATLHSSLFFHLLSLLQSKKGAALLKKSSFGFDTLPHSTGKVWYLMKMLLRMAFLLLALLLALPREAQAQCSGIWVKQSYNSQNPLSPPPCTTGEETDGDSLAPWPMHKISPSGDQYADANVRASGLWVTGKNNLDVIAQNKNATAQAEGLYIELWDYISMDGSEGFADAKSKTLAKGTVTQKGNASTLHAVRCTVECTVHPSLTATKKEFQLQSGSATPISIDIGKFGVGASVPVVIPGALTTKKWEAPEDYNQGSTCTDTVLLKDRTMGMASTQGGGLSIPVTTSTSKGMFHGKVTNALVLSQCCNQIPVSQGTPGATCVPASGTPAPGASLAPHPHIPGPISPPSGGPTTPGTPQPPTPHPYTPGGGCPSRCPLHIPPASPPPSVRGT